MFPPGSLLPGEVDEREERRQEEGTCTADGARGEDEGRLATLTEDKGEGEGGRSTHRELRKGGKKGGEEGYSYRWQGGEIKGERQLV